MTTSPLHISFALTAAIAALTQPKTLAEQCAALDTKNPHALEQWTSRVDFIARFPGGTEALRCYLFEITSRRSDLQAKSKSYTNAITRPGAWLNAQTLKWLAAAKIRAAKERTTTS
jgi:hypothetical protein